MRQKLLKAKEEAGHAVWQSGAVDIDLIHGHTVKIHEQHPEAPKVPLYFRLRPVGVKNGKLLPEHLTKIGYAMSLMAIEQSGLFKPTTHTWIAGIPAAGEPILAAMTDAMGARRQKRISQFKLEKVEDGHGRRIAGIHPDDQGRVPTNTGCEVALVDDLMTNLASKYEALDVIASHRPRVSTLLLFLDQSSKGILRLQEERGVSTHALWSQESLLEFGLAHRYINRPIFEDIIFGYTAFYSYFVNQAA